VTHSHVLVALDGSPLADEALAHALETFDCRLTVLNILTPLDAGMSEGGVLEPDADRQAAARNHADQLIERAETQAAEADRTVETAVETGDPADAIIEYATDHDVDHIVMGGHGGPQGRLTRLLGTVSTTVVSQAPMSVTIIR